MIATIITYRNYKDIDVQFEDKTIVCNRQYDAFKKGKWYDYNTQELFKF